MRKHQEFGIIERLKPGLLKSSLTVIETPKI
jgi:hypothetical protein